MGVSVASSGPSDEVLDGKSGPPGSSLDRDIFIPVTNSITNRTNTVRSESIGEHSSLKSRQSRRSAARLGGMMPTDVKWTLLGIRAWPSEEPASSSSSRGCVHERREVKVGNLFGDLSAEWRSTSSGLETIALCNSSSALPKRRSSMALHEDRRWPIEADLRLPYNQEVAERSQLDSAVNAPIEDQLTCFPLCRRR